MGRLHALFTGTGALALIARKAATVLFASAILLGTAGCGDIESDYLYTHFEKIENRAWGDSVEYFFPFRIDDLSRKYEVTGVLRYDPSFRYQKLPIGIVFETADPGDPDYFSQSIMADIPLEQEAIGARSRHFLIRELQFPIAKEQAFPDSGVYTYSLRHLADTALIGGVIEVGLIVRKL